jgi:hypothetical protein
MNPATIHRLAHPGPARVPARAILRAALAVPARARDGRPVILAVRTLAALALAEAALHCGAGSGPVAAALAGITVWYLRIVRADLAPLPDGNP